MREEWLPVIGYEGYYEVSNLGRVRSLSRAVVGTNGLIYPVDLRVLKTPCGKSGYPTVSLHKDSKARTFAVHRLVAQSFIANPQNKRTVNHIDGNKTNNHVSNLEWTTHSENYRHALAMGLKIPESSNKNGKVQGENNYAARLTDDDVRFIRKNTINFGGEMSRREMADRFGVGITTIANILYKRTWKHVK